MTALMVGTLLALGALSFVLYPLLIGEPSREPAPSPSHQLSGRNQAIDALREIEFDRATGKLSDVDYNELKSSYTQRAINEMRSGGGAVCDRCGPRPEVDARFCSNCGAVLQ
ncbi:MAG TPA: hypothetical protein VKO87_13465 [Gemmatimonadaceae bacterium]|nr:hypothetical protein [Gemmatimonadaceae bacterium]